MVPEPFIIDIPEHRLQAMKQRLRETSWPGDFGNDDWRHGVEEQWLRGMVDYWANDFDWRAQEAEMNKLPHFRVMIDDVPIHFIHLRSGKPGAIPLLLSHGWPWTFWDWRELMAPLVNGANGGPVFDLVIPSLPGFIFSTPLRTPKLGVRAVAQIWVRLMCDVLGYERFAAAGGDWGALITSELGHAHPERLLGVHLTLPTLPGSDHLALREEAFEPDDKWMIARNAEALPMITSHLAVHTTDPQTLAYALADSPVGTAAWIWERRRSWSDCGSDVTAYWGRDFLCTLVSLYWLTNSIGSSLRIYKEHFFGGAAGLTMDWPLLNDNPKVIPVPTGLSIAPKEVSLQPRSVFEEKTDLRRWTVQPRGGHFFPSEAPDLLVEEYRAFFGAL